MLAAGDAAKGLAERPSGLLRLAVPRAVVPLILEPILASFCEAYPSVTIELAASEELVDLAKDGFDAGIRMGQFIAEDMVTVRLTPPFRLTFVGSPGYFARKGRPECLEALRDQACIRIRRSSGAVGDWRVLEDGRSVDTAVTGPMIANDFTTILGAALAGVGLAQVPEPIALEHVASGALVEVLTGFAPKNPRRLPFLLRTPPSPTEAAGLHRARESQPCSGPMAAGLKAEAATGPRAIEPPQRRHVSTELAE